MYTIALKKTNWSNGFIDDVLSFLCPHVLSNLPLSVILGQMETPNEFHLTFNCKSLPTCCVVAREHLSKWGLERYISSVQFHIVTFTKIAI